MRSSSKARSRNKNNHNHNRNRGGNMGNIVNRVFDSSGPEGKVRGTPQQIIDKYQALARDAQLSGDRVAAENFLQHSEHYSRLLGEATREMNERREAQEAQRQAQQAQQASQAERKTEQQATADAGTSEQPSLSESDSGELFPGKTDDNNLVETPESQPKKQRQSKPRKKPAPKDATSGDQPDVQSAPAEAAPDSAAE